MSAVRGVEALGGAVNGAIGLVLKWIGWPLRTAFRLAVLIFTRLSSFLSGLFTKTGEGDKLFSGKLFRGLGRLFSTLKTEPKRVPSLVWYDIRRAFRRYRRPVRRALIACALAALAGVGIAVLAARMAMPTALCLTAGDRRLGYVSTRSAYDEAREQAGRTLSLGGGNGEAMLPKIKVSVQRVHADELMDGYTLYNTLLKASDAELTDACGVYIDGAFVCALKSESRARAVFNETLETLSPQIRGVSSFRQNVTYAQGLYPANDAVIWDEARLRQRLSLGDLLTVRTVTTQVITELTDYETVEVPSDELYIGATRVVTAGKSGAAQITNLVTYEGETQVGTQEISRITVQEPVAKTVQVGTRALDSSYAPGASYGGVLLWPVIGADRINSDYAWRWGKLHAALDIGSSVGTSLGKTVIAAAGGVVVISGVHSSYGYYVKIDHGNGMQTLYAHCMAGSLMVSVGQQVVAGQPIARVGQTGYATGPHLHFEVIVNGSRVDPKPYLGIK